MVNVILFADIRQQGRYRLIPIFGRYIGASVMFISSQGSDMFKQFEQQHNIEQCHPCGRWITERTRAQTYCYRSYDCLLHVTAESPPSFILAIPTVPSCTSDNIVPARCTFFNLAERFVFMCIFGQHFWTVVLFIKWEMVIREKSVTPCV